MARAQEELGRLRKAKRTGQGAMTLRAEAEVNRETERWQLEKRPLALASSAPLPTYGIATCASFLPLTLGLRPPLRPRARAAASPAWVRSRIRSRSISASAAKTWKINRPPGVEVSKPSVSERNPILRSRNSPTNTIRPRIARPKRSSFQIARTSLSRRCERA